VVTSLPTGKISFSASLSRGYADPFLISMTFDSSGQGQRPFYMKGLDTGTTGSWRSPDQGEADRLEVIVDRVTEIKLTDSNDRRWRPTEEPDRRDDFRIFPDVTAPGTTSRPSDRSRRWPRPSSGRRT
jgi:hypothetical protein